MGKAPSQSRTVQLNLGVFLLTVLFAVVEKIAPGVTSPICQNPELTMSLFMTLTAALSLANVWLRTKTCEPLKLLFLVALISGCASVPQKLDPDLRYRNDLPFCVEGYGCFEGVTVLPKLANYKFEIAPKGDAQVDLLVVNTCNRDEGNEPGDAGYVWDVLGLFGGKKKGLKYLFVPLEGKENDGDCPLVLQTLEKKLGRHAWSFIVLEHEKYQLPATLYCDGKTRRFGGQSICQGKAGLKQWIGFDEPVMIEPGKTKAGQPCDMPRRDETGHYQWKITRGECGYTIRGGASNRLHQLTAIGYEGQLIREVK